MPFYRRGEAAKNPHLSTPSGLGQIRWTKYLSPAGGTDGRAIFCDDRGKRTVVPPPEASQV